MIPRSALVLALLTVITVPVLAEETPYPQLPAGLDRDAYAVPEDNPVTPAKVELGKLLYFDKRVSIDDTISCASCHHPQKGWADDKPTSLGVDGKTGNRNSPTVINTAFNYFQFWDGRAASLEEQAVGPMANPVEMAHTLEGVEQRIGAIEGYKPFFKEAFGDETVTIDRIAKAIASFERTVLSGNSKWDRHLAGDTSALSEPAKRGLALFEGKANCAQCHNGFNLTDGIFHNLGVGMDKPEPDLGRYEQTKQEKDKGAFKTPTLRDITRTAPYMHDGSQKTLEEVMDFYNKGGEPNAWLDPKVVPLDLTPEEISDIIEFMKSLEGDWQPMEEPKLPE